MRRRRLVSVDAASERTGSVVRVVVVVVVAVPVIPRANPGATETWI